MQGKEGGTRERKDRRQGRKRMQGKDGERMERKEREGLHGKEWGSRKDREGKRRKEEQRERATVRVRCAAEDDGRGQKIRGVDVAC